MKGHNLSEVPSITEEPKNKNHVWVKLLSLFLIVGGLSWLVYASGLWEFFTSRQRLIAFLGSLGPFAVFGFILIQVLQVIVAPIPGEVTGLIGGYVYGPVTGVVWSTIGLTLGSYAAFALARIFGRPFVEKFVEKSIIRRFDYLLHHKGAFLVFLLFLIPGTPKDYLCYILGLGHMTTTEFLVIGGVGRLFGTILLTVGGDLIRHHQYKEFSLLAAVTIVVILLAMLFKTKLERLFRIWHITSYRKNKTKQNIRSGEKHSASKQSPPKG